MKTEDKITNYLANGGLFNPEMMDHEKVRDLLMESRAELIRLRERLWIGYELLNSDKSP